MKMVLCVCPIGSATGAWWSKEEKSARTHWNGFLPTSWERPMSEGRDRVAGDEGASLQAQVQEAFQDSICLCSRLGLPRDWI